MSLINDALRRAKAVQQQTPASTHSELRFRPVDCTVVRHRSNRRWYILGLIIVLICAGFIASQLVSNTNFFKSSSAQPVQARSTVDPTPASASASEYNVPPAAHRPPVTNPAGRVANTDASATATNTPIATAESGAASTAPKPAEPRLQAIFFSPNNPSAMINGKTFFVDDKIGEYKLSAVDRQTATLVGAGKTNILALP